MKNRIFALLLLFCSVALFSCDRPQEEYSIWGQTEYFKPFLWHKHVPDTLSKTLKYEFNEDASNLKEPIVFSLYIIPDDGGESFKAGQLDAELYINGDLSTNNTFELTPESGEHEVKIGIVLTKELLEEKNIDRDYQFVFKVEKNPGIDRINDFKIGNLKERDIILEPKNDDKTPMRIRVEPVANGLKVGTLSTLFVILALLLSFITIVQVFTKRFNQLQLGKIFITADANRKNITRLKTGLKSSKEIVLTPSERSQSLIKMLFSGKVSYIVIKGLPSEIKLTPGVRAQTNATYKRNDFIVVTSGDNDELRILKNANAKEGHIIEIEYCTKKR